MLCVCERDVMDVVFSRLYCQGTKRITGQYSLLRTSAPQHWSVYTREASEIFKLSGC